MGRPQDDGVGWMAPLCIRDCGGQLDGVRSSQRKSRRAGRRHGDRDTPQGRLDRYLTGQWGERNGDRRVGSRLHIHGRRTFVRLHATGVERADRDRPTAAGRNRDGAAGDPVGDDEIEHEGCRDVRRPHFDDDRSDGGARDIGPHCEMRLTVAARPGGRVAGGECQQGRESC